MTDRELLEAAGKAFGLALPLLRDTSKRWRGWNPLEDDAEALQLAVKLKIDIEFQDHDGVEAYRNCRHGDNETPAYCAAESGEGGAAAATRRAIVRAASAMSPSEASGTTAR